MLKVRHPVSYTQAFTQSDNIQSIIMYSSLPIEFHIICDGDAQSYLEKRLALVHHPRFNVLVRFYRVTWDGMVDRLRREGAVVSDHSAGTRKFFESSDINCVFM